MIFPDITADMMHLIYEMSIYIITYIITYIAYFEYSKTKTIVIPDIEGNLDVFLYILRNSGIYCIDGKWIFNFTSLIILGDATDRGKFNLKVLEIMISLYENNIGRVTLILGNRDINKLRLITLLPQWKRRYTFIVGDKIMEWIPTRYSTKVDFAEWIFASTMGAPNLLQLLTDELNSSDNLSYPEIKSSTPLSKKEALQIYMFHIKEGLVYKYWKYGTIAHIQDNTLYMHGGMPSNWIGKSIQQEVKLLDIWLTSLKNAWDLQIKSGVPSNQILWNGSIDTKYENTKDQELLSVIFSMGMTNCPNSPIVGTISNLIQAQVQTLAESDIRYVVAGHAPRGDFAYIRHYIVNQHMENFSLFAFTKWLNAFSGNVYVTTIELDTCRGINVSYLNDLTNEMSIDAVTYLDCNYLDWNYVKGISSKNMHYSMNINLFKLGKETKYGILRYQDWFKSIYCSVDGFKHTNYIK